VRARARDTNAHANDARVDVCQTSSATAGAHTRGQEKESADVHELCFGNRASPVDHANRTTRKQDRLRPPRHALCDNQRLPSLDAVELDLFDKRFEPSKLGFDGVYPVSQVVEGRDGLRHDRHGVGQASQLGLE
jgi:hypothetical protein